MGGHFRGPPFWPPSWKMAAGINIAISQQPLVQIKRSLGPNTQKYIVHVPKISKPEVSKPV